MSTSKPDKALDTVKSFGPPSIKSLTPDQLKQIAKMEKLQQELYDAYELLKATEKYTNDWWDQCEIVQSIEKQIFDIQNPKKETPNQNPF